MIGLIERYVKGKSTNVTNLCRSLPAGKAHGSATPPCLLSSWGVASEAPDSPSRDTTRSVAWPVHRPVQKAADLPLQRSVAGRLGDVTDTPITVHPQNSPGSTLVLRVAESVERVRGQNGLFALGLSGYAFGLPRPTNWRAEGDETGEESPT